MTKAAADPSDKRTDALRSIPSVEKLLSTPLVRELIRVHGRDAVKRVIGHVLQRLRESSEIVDLDSVAALVGGRFQSRTLRALTPVINATGIMIHTNLGRAPVDPSVLEEASRLVSGYCNLEFDLEKGDRGERHSHLDELSADLFGAEAALLTNNNAGAALLVVAALASGKEVVVSRGELVEIGGAFRVPEVIEQGGARLREVGTTNRTRARDYANAVSATTGALLRVHRSNFEIVGFTEEPSLEELVDVAAGANLPLIYDEGSGRVVDLVRYGFESAMTIRQILAAGVDIVTFSTDKLIGATQGGLIVGRRDLISKCARHPLMRALRAGKESYAVIAATLRAFATSSHEERVPLYRMLATSVDDLRVRAERIAAAVGGEVIDTRSALGGGTTPSQTIASVGVRIQPENPNEGRLRLMKGSRPVVTRVDDDALIADLRTVDPSDDPVITASLKALVR